MITTAKILNYDGTTLLVEPLDPIWRELLKKHIGVVEIRLNDGRTISNEQRRKIFALCAAIAVWSGHIEDRWDFEYVRKSLTADFCWKSGYGFFSLSDVDMATAREFISYLISFCFEYGVPTKDSTLCLCDDTERYLYMCLEHRKCVICNAHAETHHVDRVGMGRDREKIVHIGLLAIALCREHHDEAHNREKELFSKNHIYGIKLDKYLCDRLNLNTVERTNTNGEHRRDRDDKG